MKKIFSLVCFLFSLVCKNTFAQDTISFKNGEVVLATNITEDSNYIYYNLFSSSDREIQSVFRDVVQQISYSNGEMKIFYKSMELWENEKSNDSLCSEAIKNAKCDLWE